MQQTAFLEPRDLITWVHITPFLRGLSRALNPESRIVEAEANRAFYTTAALAYQSEAKSAELASLVEKFGAPAIRWLLTLWHEQRHFVDYLFTNYGASQFRIGFMLRAQLEGILQAAPVNSVIAFPLDVYADSTRLRALGVSTKGPHALSQLGGFIAERRSMLARDRAAGLMPGGKIQLDGYALLEVLGSLAQLKMMALMVKSAAYGKWDTLGAAYTRFPYITAVAACLEQAGIQVLETKPLAKSTAVSLINDAILGPLLVACLMCRRANRTANTDAADESAYLPAYRLLRFVEEIKGVRCKNISNMEDGFDFINRLCKTLWGRTISDDLDEDINFTESELSKFETALGKNNADIEFMRTYVAARRRLQREFEGSPVSLCGGAGYSSRIVQGVIPKLVFVDAAADGKTVVARPNEITNETLELFDGPYGRVRVLAASGHENAFLSISRIYLFDRSGISEGRVFDVTFADRHWQRGVAASPILSLLVDGRTQVSGRDFALFLAEKQFLASGINVAYEAGYDLPKIERDPGYLFEMLDSDTLFCDLSGAKVTRDSAVMVSPWDFKFSDELRAAAKKFGKEGLCPLLSDDEEFEDLGDWNSWLINKDLASSLTS